MHAANLADAQESNCDSETLHLHENFQLQNNRFPKPMIYLFVN